MVNYAKTISGPINLSTTITKIGEFTSTLTSTKSHHGILTLIRPIRSQPSNHLHNELQLQPNYPAMQRTYPRLPPYGPGPPSRKPRYQSNGNHHFQPHWPNILFLQCRPHVGHPQQHRHERPKLRTQHPRRRSRRTRRLSSTPPRLRRLNRVVLGPIPWEHDS